jgi:hypothetical protein
MASGLRFTNGACENEKPAGHIADEHRRGIVQPESLAYSFVFQVEPD